MGFISEDEGCKKIPIQSTCEANPSDEKAHLFLYSVSNLFHFIILTLPWLSKNLSKATFKNGEIGRFNLESYF